MLTPDEKDEVRKLIREELAAIEKERAVEEEAAWKTAMDSITDIDGSGDE